MGSQDPSTSHHSQWPTVIFLVLTATAAAGSTVAVLQEFRVALPLIAAAAGGAFAYRVLTRVSDTELGGSHVWIVFLSAGCAGFACWTVVLSQTGTASAITARPTHVQILQPVSDQPVSEELDGMHGTVTNLPEGDILWPMVQTVGEHEYYLMPAPCSIAATGQWTCETVYLGPDRSDQHKYRILIRILDGRAQQQAINDWITAAEERHDSLVYGHLLGRSGPSVTVQRLGPP